ncbi:ferredoxin [Candidatus Micrarchaeota archaeon CG08_land_8_20_14_0_20_59_11]|nr:MAG: ferredoxin [Candidatus Micrarchaeota archaeon CG08_land_8_20_14_0_20_59_11]PIT85461.1 MAG: ferredoxin [Candidatus Micrarchaeota archaeon CG10_big_fil_rev_8_21_14_0_10_59_7]
MKPSVDKKKCIGCGLCASICPDVFEMGADGKSRVKNAAGCAKCDCKRAAESCPAGAISLR